MYYGNSYGYGSSCGCQSVNPCYSTGYYGNSNGYAIILVLFILLIIILGARNYN